MKLLLTSAGFSNLVIGQKFLELLNKPANEAKILFIPTASRTEEENFYVNKSKEELIGLGIKNENIAILDLQNFPSFNQILEYNAIYVCGGNTYYLSHKLKEIKFDNIIKKAVQSGILYIGVSAGSIFASPDISISRDKNDVGSIDLTGMNLTEIVPIVHYVPNDVERQSSIKKVSKRFKTITLTDIQALLIIDGKEKLIE